MRFIDEEIAPLSYEWEGPTGAPARAVAKGGSTWLSLLRCPNNYAVGDDGLYNVVRIETLERAGCSGLAGLLVHSESR